jgi:hypothetical protein
VALAVLHGMLAPHVKAGRLLILDRHVPAGIQKSGAGMIAGVMVKDQKSVCQKQAGINNDGHPSAALRSLCRFPSIFRGFPV